MLKKASSESQLNTTEVDDLLVLCEEVMRATPKGAIRFIEPAPGVLARAKSKQHNIVFGRRGSGKSSLLRKTAADLTIDRRPIAFVDLETFKGHTYPDVLISVLIKTLGEFEQWLNGAAVNPATKTSFWKRLFGTAPKRPPFHKAKTAALNSNLKVIISDLEAQLRAPETSTKQTKTTVANELSTSGQLNTTATVPGLSSSASANFASKSNGTKEEHASYVSHKVEYLHQNILRFQHFFKELSTLTQTPIWQVDQDRCWTNYVSPPISSDSSLMRVHFAGRMDSKSPPHVCVNCA